MEEESNGPLMLAGPVILGVYVGRGCGTRKIKNVGVDVGCRSLPRVSRHGIVRVIYLGRRRRHVMVRREGKASCISWQRHGAY